MNTKAFSQFSGTANNLRRTFERKTNLCDEEGTSNLKPTTIMIIYDIYYMITFWSMKYIGVRWKRTLLVYILSSLYLGWIYGVNYNYEPLTEREQGFNVLYSVHLKPLVSNVWNNAGNDTSMYPNAFSVMEFSTISLFGYFTYMFNGWFGSYLTFPVLFFLDIPFQGFLFFDLIASGRKYNFQGFFPTVGYYSIMVILAFGVLRAFVKEEQEELITCTHCRQKRFFQILKGLQVGFDIFISYYVFEQAEILAKEATSAKQSKFVELGPKKEKPLGVGGCNSDTDSITPKFEFVLTSIVGDSAIMNDNDDLPPLIDIPESSSSSSSSGTTNTSSFEPMDYEKYIESLKKRNFNTITPKRRKR